MPQNPKPATKRRPGRPPHVATGALRKKVSIAAGGGMRHTDIALGLGISTDTLLRYYAEELSTGALARRMEVLSGLHAMAKKGNPGAVRAYLAIEPHLAAPSSDGAQPAAPAAAPAPAAPTAIPGVKLGKKEQAQADAVSAAAGTEWADLLGKQPPAALQ